MNDHDSKLADIRWDDNGQPVSTQFDDIYFSKTSGIEETRYVFLDGNRLSERWQEFEPPLFTIAETGFGTGLNFLLSWQLWQNTPKKNPNTRLVFISVEKYPLSYQQLNQALSLWPELEPLASQLIAAYPPQPLYDRHSISFDQGNVTLNLYFGEAHKGFEELLPIYESGPNVASLPASFGGPQSNVDAWFLDGFAPSKNPDMWDAELFKIMSQLSSKDSSFATFTAASAVRRGLQDQGFNCNKRKGYGRKREMLVGEFQGTTQETESRFKLNSDNQNLHFRKHQSLPYYADQSWQVQSKINPTPKHVVVIGGGLAGCHTAFALANKDIHVTLLEREQELAQHASGNRQGIVYAKLSPHRDPLSTFNLSAFIFANHFYKHFDFYRTTGEQCGVFQLASNSRQREHYQAIAEYFLDANQFASWVEQENSRALAGVELSEDALYLPQAGWLSPVELCKALTHHPNIEVRSSAKVNRLEFNDTWKIELSTGDAIASDCIVIANAIDAAQLDQCTHLPLKSIRGQVSHIEANQESTRLSSVICGEGYLAPSLDGLHSFGATFTLKNNRDRIEVSDHQENLKKLAELSPRLHSLADQAEPSALAGKVGFRCTTPDYFPIVGPVAQPELTCESFTFLRKKANAIIDKPGEFYPGLYANLGHGSRGLCYTPLCAEILASIITGQHLPTTRSLFRFLHPARFLIRDLARNRI